MSILPVPQMRSTIEARSDGLCITIPARRQGIALFFLPVWLVGWLFGESFAIRDLSSGKGPNLFLMVWLAGWTVGGAAAALTWLWMLAGRERILIRSNVLIHRHELLGIGRAREYALANIKNLRVSPEPLEQRSKGSVTRFLGGVIAFDYGARTIRFGASIDEAEGSMIVGRIKDRYGLARGLD